MKNSILYTFEVSKLTKKGNIKLRRLKNTYHQDHDFLEPLVKSPELEDLISVSTSVWMSITAPPLQLFALDKQKDAIQKHEIIFWYANTNRVYGEHLHSGMCVTGFLNGYLSGLQNTISLAVLPVRFDEINLNNLPTDEPDEWNLALKIRQHDWDLAMVNLECKCYR